MYKKELQQKHKEANSVQLSIKKRTSGSYYYLPSDDSGLYLAVLYFCNSAKIKNYPT